MKTLIEAPEFKLLSPERVFQELRHALGCARPSVFFRGLRSIGGLLFYFQELEACGDWEARMAALDVAEDLLVRYAILTQDTGTMGSRLLVPNDWTEAASTYSRFSSQVLRYDGLRAEDIVTMLYEMDAFRKPNSVQVLAHLSRELATDFELIKNISAKDVALNFSGKEIGEAIREKRIGLLRTKGK